MNRVNNVEGLHLVGVISFFIASKAFDKSPVDIGLLRELVVRKAFSFDEIRDKEQEILTTIQFNFDPPTVYELIQQLASEFVHQYNVRDEDANSVCRIKGRSIYIAFMCCFDEDMLCYKYYCTPNHSPLLLAKAILNVATQLEKKGTKGKRKLFDDIIHFKQDLHMPPFEPLTEAAVKKCSQAIRKLQKVFPGKYQRVGYKNLQNLNIFYYSLTELLK